MGGPNNVTRRGQRDNETSYRPKGGRISDIKLRNIGAIHHAIQSSLCILGCAKNLVNTEQMMALCRRAGYDVTGETEGADVAVLNTCGFIEPLRPRLSKPFWRPPRISRPAI